MTPKLLAISSAITIATLSPAMMQWHNARSIATSIGNRFTSERLAERSVNCNLAVVRDRQIVRVCQPQGN
jgi:hypothetical protein